MHFLVNSSLVVCIALTTMYNCATGTMTMYVQTYGGSLNARPPVLNTNRPGGLAMAAELSGVLLLGPYTRSPISALIDLGNGDHKYAAIVSADLHR